MPWPAVAQVRARRGLVLFAACLLGTTLGPPLEAQTPTGTAFTYQGRLMDAGAPASGNRDFSFALYDAETDGAPIGTPVALSGVAVANGLFTVELDFGPAAFGASARWLEISVGPEGGTLTVLAPRQRLTPAPMAIHSARAGTLDATAEAGTSVVNALNSVSTMGTLDPARLPAQFARRDQANMFTATLTPLHVRPSAAPPANSRMVSVENPGAQVLFSVDAEGDVVSRGSLSVVGVGGQTTFVVHARPSSTGGANLFAGQSAGLANTTGSANVFLGTNAGEANTAQFQNTFVGHEAGRANTASNNTFLGALAGAANTSGVANVFVGRESGRSNTTGGSNTFVGHEAGSVNTVGGDNTFVGTSAGLNSTTGSRNTMVGTGAGFNINSGVNNTFLGTEAGAANTTGNSNTFLGRQAGTAITTESSNTLVGAHANGVAGITNATAIGANAVVTQSNTVVLGANARVGIKESAPVEELHIGGGGTIALAPRTNNPAGTPGVYKLYIFQAGTAVQLRIVSPSGNIHQIATITE